uniref:Zinc metalloproteinase n=1 Tax=Parastrongyloides trichosuri TaxID=131310 RepID=A0A0N4ZZT6_PARTI
KNVDSTYLRVKRTIMKDMYYKWTFPIEYDTDYRVNLTTVQKALKNIEAETCLSFKKVSQFSGPGLKFVYGSGCVSFIGKVSDNRPQEVSLGKNCDYVVVAQHETSHALGVIHEMTRPDRGNHITVNTQNIDPRVMFNFEQNPADRSLTYGLRYDYGSVMHYDRLAGSANSQMVMVPKKLHYLQTIGQREEFGFNDAKQLNLHYCSDKCKNKLKCKVGGYPNPKKCNECKCPRFYTGPLCGMIKPSDSGCGKSKYVADSKIQSFTLQGKRSCYIQIAAPVGFKVRITIESGQFTNYFVCIPGNGLEVKFLADKSVSGAVFCGKVTNKVMVSEKHVVVMRYVGTMPFHNTKIKYQKVKA